MSPYYRKKLHINHAVRPENARRAGRQISMHGAKYCMGFLSGLALVLLSLVGYSSGASLGAKGRTSVPGLLDLLVIVAMWVLALATRSAMGKWVAIAVWILIGLGLGALLAALRAKQYSPAKKKDEVTDPQRGLPGRVWEGWKRFSRRMGNYQSRVLMGFLYFTVVLPFGLGVTLLGDPLNLRKPSGVSTWQSKDLPLKPSLNEAGRQF
jgi:hypothetical protein